MYEIGVATMPPFAVGCAICFGFLAVKSRSFAVPSLFLRCVVSKVADGIRTAARQLRGRFPGWRFDPTAPSTLYAAAAILVPAIVPYTLAVMVPTNDRLMAKAKGLGNMGLQETRVLVEKWKGMNYVRAAMAGVATLLAGWATVVR